MTEDVGRGFFTVEACNQRCATRIGAGPTVIYISDLGVNVDIMDSKFADYTKLMVW